MRDHSVRPADVCATIDECLGFDPDLPIHDRTGRPIPLGQGGRAIHEILA